MTKKTIYFGFGSNLWRSQMASRCPSSPYLGLARLNNYRWIINSRGYANVVEIPADERREPRRDFVDEVWGLVYALPAADERRLDGNEGVPESYTKEILKVDFWSVEDGGTGVPKIQPLEREPDEVEMLVYIDRKRTSPDKPKKEYIYRMNMGIRDALNEGVPKEYVTLVMRPFIPEEDEEDQSLEASAWRLLAQKQAVSFEDED